MGNICVANTVGVASVNLRQLAPKAAVLCEITHKMRPPQGRSRLPKVTDFGTEYWSKAVCDFLLLNSTNLCSLQTFPVTAAYLIAFDGVPLFNFLVRGETLNSGLQI